MGHFTKEVDLTNEKEVKEYLFGHFDYHIMNSWNRMRSFANNMKLSSLPLSNEEYLKLFDLMECEEAYEQVNMMIEDWKITHHWLKVFWNGRSGGYLVLVTKDYKSLIPDHCDGHFLTEGGYEWELSDYVSLAEDVMAFGALCENILEYAKWAAENLEIVEETYTVEKTRKVIKEKECV